MRAKWNRKGLIKCDWGPDKNGELWTQTCTLGEDHVKMKAKDGALRLQAKENQ
jgi:hypothetical protein